MQAEGPPGCHSYTGMSGTAVTPPEVHPTATHIDLGGLGKGPHGVDVVVEDDDSNHHPHAEEEGLGVGEAAPVLPARGEGGAG